jgi:HPt (histidine-containing phosphotransfer) domain-containing protein
VRACWNKTEALKRIDGDQQLLQELCRIFLVESPRLMEKLRLALKEDDAEALARAAHSLKGETSCLAAANAARLARQLEEMGRGHNLSQAAETVELLDREIAELQVALLSLTGVNP